MVFCDLREFTPFAESSEPEEVMAVLDEYHAALGDLIYRFEGTLERFTGDGLMVFFNDPMPCDDAAARAVRMASRCATGSATLAERWRRHGHDLGLGIGIAQGYATLGRIGFEGRFDYAAIGSVTNLAARLCAEAEPWQILVTQRVLRDRGTTVVGEPVGELELRGFSRPVRAFDVKGLDTAAGQVMTGTTDRQGAGTALVRRSTRTERYRALRRAAGADARRLGRHAPQPRGRVGRGRAVGHPRPGRRRAAAP